jgi:predicted ATPase/DNA-binding SARP family transcriptional activator
MSQLALYLLGPPRVERGGEPAKIAGRKALALLAYLTLERRSHCRDALATLLWPESDASRARAELRRALSNLRRALGAEWLEADRETVGLRQAQPEEPDWTLWLDVEAFREQLRRCETHDHGAGEVCAECVPSLEEAVRLYRDDFLAGFTLRDSLAYDEWQFFQTQRLKDQLASAIERLVRWYESREEYDRAIAHARRRLEHDTLNEAAHYQLMELYALAGQQTAALRQYELCRQTLAEELGISPSAETTALYERVRVGQDIGREPELVTPHNLPPQATLFIGREKELADLSELIANPGTRLVTILGPGGIGKTRLALALAERLLGAALEGGATPIVTDGVFFAPLARLSDADQIVPSIAEALNFRLGGGERDTRTPRQQVLDYLWEKRLLLILDNFEHLLEGVDLVTDILRTAPAVQLLVTSRERLNLREEHVDAIQGLVCPDDVLAKDWVEYAAVKLFLDTARRVQTDFEFSSEDAASITRICRMLDGMPLGIELAAGWVDVLSLSDIAAEIDRGLDLLETEWHDVPARHRSMRAVLDTSWRCLNEKERNAFSELCVFRGGFTRQAAKEVAGADLRTLARLVDKSLLNFGRARERYDVHELLRQYGRERLAADPQQEQAARDRHSAHFCDALGRWGDAWNRGIRPKPEFDLEADWSNLQEAWRWAADKAEVDRLDLALDGMCFLAVARLLPWREAERLFQYVVDGLSETPQPRNADSRRVLAKALLFRCDFNYYTGKTDLARSGILQSKALLADPAVSASDIRAEWSQLHVVLAQQSVPDWEKVRWHFQESLALRRDLDHLGVLAFRMLNIAWTYAMQGNYDEVVCRGEEALRIFVSSGNQIGELRARHNLSWYAVNARNLRELERCSRALCARAADYGNVVYQETGLELLGMAAVLLGRYSQAERRLKDCREMAQGSGNRDQLFRATRLLGEVAWFRDDADAAERWLAEALDLAQRDRVLEGIILCKRRLSYIACARRDFERAERLCEDSLVSLPQHDRFHSGLLKLALARVALFRSDPMQLVEQFQECLEDLRPTGGWDDTICALEDLSWALAALERYEEAARLLGFLAADRERTGLVLPPVDRPHHKHALSLSRDGLSEEAFEAAWELGAALTLEEAVDFALAA